MKNKSKIALSLAFATVSCVTGVGLFYVCSHSTKCDYGRNNKG